jgi:signal transduction histidine kinase
MIEAPERPEEGDVPEDRPSVLIIDDELGPSESLRMILSSYYNVYLCREGGEGLETLRRHPIDVVTLDLRMPSMGGIDVLKQIKQIDPDVEVIIVTAYASLETAVQGLRWGAFDYICKPFDVPHIAELVDRAIKRRRARLYGRRSREHFLGNLSHELRTPLSAIIGYSSILQEELASVASPEQLSALNRIQANGLELLNLIEGVLILNGIDAGEISPHIAEFDAVEVARQVLSQFEAQASEKGVTLAMQTLQEHVFLNNDAAKLGRILWGLLDNALKFGGGAELTLQVEAHPTSGGVRFLLLDPSSTIDADELQLAIDGYLQDDIRGRRRDRGLGIGLRVAVQFTRMLGGRMRVRRLAQEGTRIELQIPSWDHHRTSALH